MQMAIFCSFQPQTTLLHQGKTTPSLSLSHVDHLNFTPFYLSLRLQDLELYLPQLQHYKEVSTSLTEWINATSKKQDTLQATSIEDVEALKDHINDQKVFCSALRCY